MRESSAPGRLFAWDEAALDGAPNDTLFEPAAWQAAARVIGQATGRGAAYFVTGDNGAVWVLRHYRRGGVLANINHHHYLWTGKRRMRPLREFRLLSELSALGLPVPEPVAARVCRRGPMYRGDILIRGIDNTEALADRLNRTALDARGWQTLGALIARFHAVGVWHADLNARNVLVDIHDDFYLIDFDRARFRRPGRWQPANLARLRRSLDKFADANRGFNFAEHDWAALLGGYQSEKLKRPQMNANECR